MCYRDGMADERQATTVRLTRRQLKWIKDEAWDRHCSQQDVIEAALVAVGAPKDGS
jgi:tRNA A37 N6-isopentenylltransferase MiaA